MAGVYQIYNKETNKRYIGSKQRHLMEARVELK